MGGFPMRKIILAHYYTVPEVQKLADHVGDSLDLALAAKEAKADQIIFLGVRFMAETAKILNPNSEVIIPTLAASCSLVEQTEIEGTTGLRSWVYMHRARNPDIQHVAYINTSAEHKALSDWIVTSRNVEDVIKHIYDKGQSVIFSPDRNMGAYLNYTNNWKIPLWSAVCDVHDQFNLEELAIAFMQDPGRKKILLSHPESPLSVLKQADVVGSTHKMLNWVKNTDTDAIIYVATEDGLLFNMREARPDLDIRQAPTYKGCQCNSCPFMKMNTLESAQAAIRGIGDRIDYLTDEVIEKARVPVERMLDFK